MKKISSLLALSVGLLNSAGISGTDGFGMGRARAPDVHKPRPKDHRAAIDAAEAKRERRRLKRAKQGKE